MDEFSACQSCLCMASRRAARGITAVFDRHLRPHGLRSTQFTILVMAMLRGGAAISDLAKGLGMDRTTLTRNVALLEANGWAQSQPDDKDARVHAVSVTDKGRALALAALPAWRTAQDSVADAFGPMGVAALQYLAGTAMPGAGRGQAG
jgi:DNA-binding MarR family transcriptional regulator